jgi:hypothetical protein
VKLLTFGLLVRVLCIVALLLLALFAGRRGLRRHSIKMNNYLDGFLKTRTLAEQLHCEKLLDGIAGCKAIADKALSSPVQVEDLRRALGEISNLLARTLDG